MNSLEGIAATNSQVDNSKCMRKEVISTHKAYTAADIASYLLADARLLDFNGENTKSYLVTIKIEEI